MDKLYKILYLTNKVMIFSDYKANYKDAYDEACRYYNQIQKSGFFRKRTHVGTDFVANAIAENLMNR